MEFKLALLAVKNIEASIAFYRTLFDQTVVLDLGKNVTLSGGFALQEDFSGLLGLPDDSVVTGPHNMELYFEVEDFDAFMEKLAGFDVRYVHPPKKYPWQQRVIRIYDPDRHIIEIGEAMAAIARRYLSAGYTVEQSAEMIQHPVEFVHAVMDRAE